MAGDERNFTRTVDTFGHVAEFGEDGIQRLACCVLRAFRQHQPHTAVTRQVAGAGEYQIAYAGEPHEGFRTPAERHAQPRDFREAACHQSRTCIQTQIKAVANAGGDGHNVFHRTAQLHADKVTIGVHAEGFAAVDFFTVSKTAYTLPGQPL